MIDATFHVERSGDGSRFCLEIGRSIHNEFWAYVNAVGAKTNDHFRVRIDRPARSITRGYRSQMARWWGHCADIAEQLSAGRRHYTKEQVSESLKVRAVREHYPTEYNDITDQVEPQGLESCTAEDYEILERVKQRFSDEHNLWLTEYDEECPHIGRPAVGCLLCGGTGKLIEPIPYHSIAGRSRREMEAYWNAGR
jgi:hypothetical protein